MHDQIYSRNHIKHGAKISQFIVFTSKAQLMLYKSNILSNEEVKAALNLKVKCHWYVEIKL